MDKVYKNLPEYITTKVTQLRFVELRFDCGNQARSVNIGPTYNSRQIRAILMPMYTPNNLEWIERGTAEVAKCF